MSDYSLKAIITADSSGFENAVKKAQKTLEKFGSTFKSFEGVSSKLSKALGSLTPQFVAAAGAVTILTKSLTKLGKEMSAANAEIINGTGAVGKDLESLKDSMKDVLVGGVSASVKDVGIMIADLNTRFDATGKTLTNLADKFDGFARVTGTGTKESINGVADVIEKWGMSVEDVNPLLDQLIVASQKSGASVSTLMNGLKSGQAVFSQFGMSATQTIAFLSSLTKSGVDTNIALTGMRTALANFSREGLEAGEAFEEVSNQIKNAESETEALNIAVSVFGSRSGAEMVKVLRENADEADEMARALLNAGGALEQTEEMSRTSVEAMNELKNALKGSFSGFGEGFDRLFVGILDSARSLVDMIDPIVRPLGQIFSEVFGFIGQALKILITNFVEFQKKYNTIFKAVAAVLRSVYESIHEILGSILDSFNTAFGFIFAILDGKWKLAWEYAKKFMILTAKQVMDICSGLVNIFVEMINKMIEPINEVIEQYNKAAGVLRLKKADTFKGVDKADLSDTFGLNDKLAESNAKIAELTGKAAEKLTGELGKVKNAVTKINDETESGLVLAEQSESKYVSQLGKWQDKLLNQEIRRIEKERDARIDEIKNAEGDETEKQEKINKVYTLYSDKLIKLKREQLQKERDVALAQEGLTEQEKQAIRKYYAQEITAMEADESSKRVKSNKKTNKEIINDTKSTGEKWAKVFSKMKDVAKNVAETTTKVLKASFEALSDVLRKFGGWINKAFELNLDDSIEQLLKYEDKILTFFIETVPKLPSYVASAIQSISTMFKTLNANIDKGTIAEVISGMITNLANELPSLISNLWGLISNVANGIVEGLNAGMPAIKEFGKTLPETIKGIITDVTSNFGNFEELLNGITDVFETFVTSLADNEIFADLGNLFGNILTTIVNSIDDLIPSIEKALDEIIPALGKFITDSIPSIINLLIDVAVLIVKEVPKIVLELVKAIPVIVKALLEALPKFFDEGLPELIAGFIQIIPDIIKAGVEITVELIKHLPEIIGSFIKGLILGFAQVNWWEVIKSIFQAFIDGFKELFGIHSPSTVFRDFGKNIWQGLMNGLKGIGEWFVGIFTKALDGIKQAFSTIGDWFKTLWANIKSGFSNAWEGVKSTAQTVGEKVGDFFSDAWEGTKNVASTVGEKVGNFFKKLKFWADGTNNAPAGLAVVGEAGPELVRFRGGEQVMNAKNTQKVLSGAGISNNFNVTFNNLQDTTAFALMQQLKQYNRQLSINGII